MTKVTNINLYIALSNFVVWYFSVVFSSQVKLQVTFALERCGTKTAFIFLCIGSVSSFVGSQIILSLELLVTEYARELGILLHFLNEKS